MSALSLKSSNAQELEETRRGIIEDLSEYQADLERVEDEMRLRGLTTHEPEVSQYEKAMRERGEWIDDEPHVAREVLAAIIDNATMFPSEDIERAADAVLASGFRRPAPRREPSGAQTLVVSHEELCGCVLDDCEFKKGWRAALRAQAKWGSA